MAKRPKKETNSFILYYELEDSLKCFRNKDDIADLFLAIFAYVRRGELPDFDNDALTALFMQIKAQLDINKEKWEHIKEVRSQAGKQGGKGNKKNRIYVDADVVDAISQLQSTLQEYSDKANKANAFFDNQNETKKAVSVNVNDTVPVSVPVSVTDSVTVSDSDSVINNNNNNINIIKERGRGNDKRSLSPTPPLIDESKITCGEYMHVFLTPGQYLKLADDFGVDKTVEYIQRVDEYCQQTGKQYKDYYLTIRKWIKADEAKTKKETEVKEREMKAKGENASLPPPEELEKILIDRATKKDLVSVLSTNEAK